MRISDWSSDVCSSDLRPTPISTWSGSDERTASRRRRVLVAGPRDARAGPLAEAAHARTDAVRGHDGVRRRPAVRDRRGGIRHRRDRKSVEEGKSGYGWVELERRRSYNKKNKN